MPSAKKTAAKQQLPVPDLHKENSSISIQSINSTYLKKEN